MRGCYWVGQELCLELRGPGSDGLRHLVTDCAWVGGAKVTGVVTFWGFSGRNTYGTKVAVAGVPGAVAGDNLETLMKTSALLSALALAVAFAAPAAEAKGRGKGKAPAASSFKSKGKTATGHAFPSKAPKAPRAKKA
jgi:hypothetical protein